MAQLSTPPLLRRVHVHVHAETAPVVALAVAPAESKALWPHLLTAVVRTVSEIWIYWKRGTLPFRLTGVSTNFMLRTVPSCCGSEFHDAPASRSIKNLKLNGLRLIPKERSAKNHV
jgi:hypothetical protein